MLNLGLHRRQRLTPLLPGVKLHAVLSGLVQEAQARIPARHHERHAVFVGDGFAKTTLKRAKKDLGIKSRKTPGKFDGAWTWELSPDGKVIRLTPQGER